MNFIISLCKITAASKIFSRNFYLPLLKPVTPKDALRTFKITGKWLLGAKRQHYIPVLLKNERKRSKNSKDYGKSKHVRAKNYTYIMPVFDPENNENHKILCSILDSESGTELYVYTVEDKKVNVILSAPIEMALRKGDIVDVLVSQRVDRILFKLKDNKVPIEVTAYEGKEETLYKGEAATTSEEEKNHHHGKYTMSLAQYFEDKERQEEEWEKELKKLAEKRNKQRGEDTKEWNDMISAGKANLDWKQFEKEAKKVIEFINEPVVEQFIPMEVDDMDKTKDVETLIGRNEDIMNKLPTMSEIPDLVNNLYNACLQEFEIDDPPNLEKRTITGVKVTLTSGKECFVTGQIVKTDEGDIFVPGQTIENEFGLEYAPGITILIDNKPTLINGIIVGEEETKNPMFVPTEATITEEGNLSFTVTKEERTKYTPIKVPKSKRKRNRKKKNDKVQHEQTKKETIIEEEKLSEPSKPVKKRKKIVKKKKAVPPKIEIDPGVIYEDNFYPEMFESIIITPVPEEVKTEEKKEVEPEDTLFLFNEYEKYSELERLLIRTMDDQIEKIISSLEIKKSELQTRLKELQELASIKQNNSVSLATTDDAAQIARMITGNPDKVGVIQDILLTMMHKLIIFPEKSNINLSNVDGSNIVDGFLETFDERYRRCNEKLKVALKTAMVAANNALKSRPKDEVSVLKAIGAVLIISLKDKNNLVNDLCEFMGTAVERNKVNDLLLKELAHKVQDNKIKMLKSVVTSNSDSYIIENVAEILHVEGDSVLKSAFKKIAINNKNLLRKIVELIKQKVKLVTTEQWAYDVTRDALLVAIQETYDEQVQEYLKGNKSKEELSSIVKETEGFARIINQDEMADTLSNSKIDCLPLTDPPYFNALRRLLIMRKLAENDCGFRAALREMCLNPSFSKTNPRVIQLIKESASLTYNRIPLRSSREIPLRLLEETNKLALEDFLIQRGVLHKPVMVSKNGIQVVVPKQDTREVQAGRVPYVLVDEDGVINFKPAHMFSSFKLGKNEDINVDLMSRRGSLSENLFPERQKARHDLRKQIRRMSQFNQRMVA